MHNHGFTELYKSVRRDRIEVTDHQRRGDRASTALHIDIDGLANRVIKQRLQRLELRDVTVFNADQHISGLQLPESRRTGLHLTDHQHARATGKRLTHSRFGIAA